uniref:Large ribosomal subunit protein uL24c n=1 Tax=Rhodymenia pseudopalmata TaxID=31502 RepID=A0A1C9C7V8_RHOPU|nr:ribosomal protein L24 [Rhodymenia pseudopalmata]AOM64468.1 ribosomal protein L24 [Rhodymenia pseudopalmata]
MNKKRYNKMHVKKGNQVKIISGKHRGKTGEIIKVINKSNKIIIKNINVIKKHIKSKNRDEPGQIISAEAPIHSSNVAIYQDS